jgi:hypothetical protein
MKKKMSRILPLALILGKENKSFFFFKKKNENNVFWKSSKRRRKRQYHGFRIVESHNMSMSKILSSIFFIFKKVILKFKSTDKKFKIDQRDAWPNPNSTYHIVILLSLILGLCPFCTKKNPFFFTKKKLFSLTIISFLAK